MSEWSAFSISTRRPENSSRARRRWISQAPAELMSVTPARSKVRLTASPNVPSLGRCSATSAVLMVHGPANDSTRPSSRRSASTVGIAAGTRASIEIPVVSGSARTALERPRRQSPFVQRNQPVLADAPRVGYAITNTRAARSCRSLLFNLADTSEHRVNSAAKTSQRGRLAHGNFPPLPPLSG